MILDVAFKRAINVCKKPCLQVGLTFTILDVAFKRATDVCKKQFLWVGLTCIALDKLPLIGLLMYVENNASN